MFMRQVLDAVGSYLEQGSPPEMDNFSRWLLIQSEAEARKPAAQYQTESLESDNFMYLANLGRFSKSYTKQAFEHSSLRTVEEFTILARLWGLGACTKAEIIKELILEFSVGAEIIRRLVNQGFVAEQKSKTDKRQKIISLTTLGQEELLGVMTEAQKVSQLLNGKLSEEEKQTLHFLLSKLHGFHWDVRNVQQHESLDSILMNNGIVLKTSQDNFAEN